MHDFQNDSGNCSNRENFLNFLTNSFDQYVSTTNEEYDNFSKHKNLTNKDQRTQNSDHEEENIYETEDKFPQKPKLKTFGEKVKKIFRILCITKGKRNGNYLLVLFVFCRILFTLNSVIQLFILNHFLGNDYLLLGFEGLIFIKFSDLLIHWSDFLIQVISKIYNGDDWTQLKRFPRVTMCDFRIREVGIVHRYTVQCVLSINLFNEKIFM